MGVEIPAYTKEVDPTKAEPCSLEWTIPTEEVKSLDKQYSKTVRELMKNRKRGSSGSSSFKEEEVDEFEFKCKKFKKEKAEPNEGDSATTKTTKVENGEVKHEQIDAAGE